VIEVKYTVEHLDQRDGGKHAMLLHWKDTVTGMKKSTLIAYFEAEAGKVAEAMASWANEQNDGGAK